MRASIQPFLFWPPRILGVTFALFLGVFVLDVFEPERSAGALVGALAMHLIPSLALLLVLAVAWRHELVGGMAYVGLGILYLVMSWGRFHWSAYALISGSLCFIGALFLVYGWARRQVPPASTPSLGRVR